MINHIYYSLFINFRHRCSHRCRNHSSCCAYPPSKFSDSNRLYTPLHYPRPNSSHRISAVLNRRCCYWCHHFRRSTHNHRCSRCSGCRNHSSCRAVSNPTSNFSDSNSLNTLTGHSRRNSSHRTPLL